MSLTTRIRTFAVAALLAPLLVLLPHLPAQAASCAGQVRGINLVPLPTGWYDNAVEMKFPDASYVAYYKGVGLRAIRLPLYWEDMQPIFGGSLNARYLQHTREFLDVAQANGMKVLIDLHNYARYRKVLIGSPDVPVASFASFWKRLVAELKSHPAIFAWGLMNEPHHTGGT